MESTQKGGVSLRGNALFLRRQPGVNGRLASFDKGVTVIHYLFPYFSGSCFSGNVLLADADAPWEKRFSPLQTSQTKRVAVSIVRFASNSQVVRKEKAMMGIEKMELWQQGKIGV
jgi:hypothetical protein